MRVRRNRFTISIALLTSLLLSRNWTGRKRKEDQSCGDRGLDGAGRRSWGTGWIHDWQERRKRVLIYQAGQPW